MVGRDKRTGVCGLSYLPFSLIPCLIQTYINTRRSNKSMPGRGNVFVKADNPGQETTSKSLQALLWKCVFEVYYQTAPARPILLLHDLLTPSKLFPLCCSLNFMYFYIYHVYWLYTLKNGFG